MAKKLYFSLRFLWAGTLTVTLTWPHSNAFPCWFEHSLSGTDEFHSLLYGSAQVQSDVILVSWFNKLSFRVHIYIFLRSIISIVPDLNVKSDKRPSQVINQSRGSCSLFSLTETFSWSLCTFFFLKSVRLKTSIHTFDVY